VRLPSILDISRSLLGGVQTDHVLARLTAINLSRDIRSRPDLLLRTFTFAAVVEWSLLIESREAWMQSSSYLETKVERRILAKCE
jgi:hypothetical protein